MVILNIVLYPTKLFLEATMLSEHEVTPDLYQQFAGGSVEIDWRNQLYYGQLAELSLWDDHLRISFEWLAQNRATFSVIASDSWDVVPLPALDFCMINAKYFDAGYGRIFCQAEFIGARMTFMPESYGSPIPPEMINGLNLEQQQKQREQYEKFMSIGG